MKKIISVFLALILSLTFITSAFADSAPVEQIIAAEDSSIQPRAEELMWYFRYNNGVPEKRLWSITYGKWLTDWIPA